MKNEYVSYRPKQSKVEFVYEKDLKITEVTCSVFGCGRILTREEKLFGNKCLEHQKTKGGLDYLKNYLFKME